MSPKYQRISLYDLYLSKRSLITNGWELYNDWVKTSKRPIPVQKPITLAPQKPVQPPVALYHIWINRPSLYHDLEYKLIKTIKNLSPINIIISKRDKLLMFVKITDEKYNYDSFTIYKNNIENVETDIINQMIDYCEIHTTNNIFTILYKLNVPISSKKEVIIEKLKSMLTC